MKPRAQQTATTLKIVVAPCESVGTSKCQQCRGSRRALCRRRPKGKTTSATFTPQRRPPGSLGKQRFGALEVPCGKIRPPCVEDTEFSRSRPRTFHVLPKRSALRRVPPGGTSAPFRDWTPKSTIPCPSPEPNRIIHSADLPISARAGR